MKRDELLRTIRRVEHVQDRDGIQWCPSCGQNKEANEPHDLPCEMASAIAWLERLPAGCELVGLDENHSIVRRIDGPDDLTNAGKSRQFEALECKKCNLDGPDNCWNHKVGKR